MGIKKAVVGFELSYENIEEIRFCTPFCTPGRPLIPPFSVPYRLNFQPIDVPGGKVLHFAGAGLGLARRCPNLGALHSSGLRGQGQERQRIHFPLRRCRGELCHPRRYCWQCS